MKPVFGTSNTGQTPSPNNDLAQKKETPKPGLTKIYIREKTQSDTSRMPKFTLSTPRQIKKDPTSNIAPSPRTTEESPIIRSDVDFSTVNFFFDANESREDTSKINTKPPSLPIAEGELSEFKKARPTSPRKSDLSKVISPRGKNTFSGSIDSSKASSDNADLQESKRKAPKGRLLRSDRALELKERVRASNLPRAVTQRGDRPEIRTMSPRGVQGGLRQELPPLPSILLHSLSNELPLAHQDNQPIDEEIPTTTSRPAEDESSKSSQDLDETSTVSTEPLALQPHSAFFDDDDREAASLIAGEALPENPSDQTGEDPREGLRQQRIQRDLTNPGLKTLKRGEGASQITPLTGTAPNSSKKLAVVVKLLILNHPSSSVSDTVRALRMIKCAAGGGAPSPDSDQPETKDCAVKLSNLLRHETYDYLQALFDQLQPYLLKSQKLLIDRYLDGLKLKARDPAGTEFTLTILKAYLEEEISRTIIGDMAETAYQAIKDDEDDRSRSFRAVNMVFCAAGGTVETVLPLTGQTIIEKMPLIPSVGMYPEFDKYALKLIDIPNESRYEYVKALFDKLSPFLTDSQRRLVRSSLDKIKNTLNDPKLVEREFYRLRRDLRADFFK